MKIWSDSLPYLKSMLERYGSPVESILSDVNSYNDWSYSDEEAPTGCLGEGNKGDCQVAEPYHGAQTYLPLDKEQVPHLTEHHFQLANTLHIQACDRSHWLICNPIEAGNIAVVDEESLALLESFRTPTTLQEVSATRDISIPRLLPPLLLFLHLLFLFDLDQAPVTRSKQSRASTLSAWLHITNACNLRCHYCYVSKSSEHMEQETSRRAVDAVIRSAVRHGYQRVHLKYRPLMSITKKGVEAARGAIGVVAAAL